MTLTQLLTYFGEVVVLLDIYVVFRAITRGHGVESTIAWILAIIAFPVVGALGYLLLARPKLRGVRRRKRVSRELARQKLAAQLDARACAEAVASSEACAALTLAATVTRLTPTGGNQVTLLAEDEQAFGTLGKGLREAQRSIWAEYYIIRNDETGHRFFDILVERARQGVEVRLLYDGVGSLGLDRRRIAALERAGGHVSAFLPVNPLARRWSVNLRNHRKMVVVDGQLGFTGGMNVGDEYSGRARWKGDQFFHDTHLALQGPAVWDLAVTFSEDWAFATGERIDLPEPPARLDEGSVVAIVPSGPDQEHNANALCYFSGIASARRRCWLQSPYFIPDEPTAQALIAAALRGVDVRVLVPARCDVKLVGYAGRSYYRALLRSGVRIFEFLPSMLHAKTLVVDSAWCLIGSANVDIRSFRLNFELGALIVDAEFAADFERHYEEDLASSREVKAGALARIGPLGRLRDGVARLLSPLL